MNQKRKNIPAFLRNTFEMLQRQDLQHIVSWAQHGNGFLIKDLDRFSLQILPQYFKHKKYTSFVRQLNMYGFHKQRHHQNYNHFAHEHFRKGQIDNENNRRILSQIKRKPQKKKKQTQQLKNDIGNIKYEDDYSKQKYQEQRSVSLALEDEKISQAHPNQQNSDQKQQFSQSIQKQRSNNFNQAYSQDQDQLDHLYMTMTMRQNEILRGLHLLIRQQVINSKKRSLQSLTNQSSQEDLQRAEHISLMKLIEELNQGTIKGIQILQSQKISQE